MIGYKFNVTLLVAADTIEDAADGVNELLRDSPEKLILDWYLAPDGWQAVNVPDGYVEGDAFVPGWAVANLHGTWVVECVAANGEVLVHREFILRDEAEEWRDEMLPFFTGRFRVDVFRKLA